MSFIEELSVLTQFKQNWKPDYDKAKIHVKAVVRNYSQCDELVLKKQLEVTHKGLVASGFTNDEASSIIEDVTKMM